MVKNPPANTGDIRDASLIPGYGRSPGGGHGNPLQYSCLGNPMVREAWRATVHGAAKSWARLSTQTQHSDARDCSKSLMKGPGTRQTQGRNTGSIMH